MVGRQPRHLIPPPISHYAVTDSAFLRRDNQTGTGKPGPTKEDLTRLSHPRSKPQKRLPVTRNKTTHLMIGLYLPQTHILHIKMISSFYRLEISPTIQASLSSISILRSHTIYYFFPTTTKFQILCWFFFSLLIINTNILRCLFTENIISLVWSHSESSSKPEKGAPND